MKMLLIGIGFAFVCGVFSEQDDPCSTYQPLPRAAYRGGRCPLDQEKAVCDVYLNPATWYRAEGLNGYLTMQESPAPFMTCGTKYPLWMNGTHPAVSDGVVERQACQSTLSNTCFSSNTIKVKNCGSFYTYQMPDTESCPEAYCFGEDDECPPFDPCDYYERSTISYDVSRSSSCDVSDVSSCDRLGGDTWYKFRGESGHLTLATSCPRGTTCGTQSPLWISGTVTEYANGTQSNTVCVKIGDDCCAESFTIESKQCTDFMVYNLSEDFDAKCQRYCTDDTSATCPPVNIHTTTTESDHHEDKDKDETRGGVLWVIPLALCVLLVGVCVGSGVTYIIVTKLQKQKIRDSRTFVTICEHDPKKQDYFTSINGDRFTPPVSHKCP